MGLTRSKTTLAAIVIALLVAVPLGTSLAGASTYSSCSNVSSTPTFKLLKNLSVQEQLKLKCASARKVVIRVRVKNVYCTVVALLSCKTRYFQMGGNLGGTWKAGQTRTATWVHQCDGAWQIGGDIVGQLYGANYGQNSWSVDGGKHWSSWVGNGSYRVAAC